MSEVTVDFTVDFPPGPPGEMPPSEAQASLVPVVVVGVGVLVLVVLIGVK